MTVFPYVSSPADEDGGWPDRPSQRGNLMLSSKLHFPWDSRVALGQSRPPCDMSTEAALTLPQGRQCHFISAEETSTGAQQL